MSQWLIYLLSVYSVLYIFTTCIMYRTIYTIYIILCSRPTTVLCTLKNKLFRNNIYQLYQHVYLALQPFSFKYH